MSLRTFTLLRDCGLKLWVYIIEQLTVGVRNKAIAPGKSQKNNKSRAMSIPGSRVEKGRRKLCNVTTTIV